MKHIKELTEYIDELDHKTLSSLQFLKSLKDNTTDKILSDWDSEIRKDKPNQERLGNFCEALCERMKQINIDEDRISEMKNEFMDIIRGYSKASNRVPYINNVGTGYFPEKDYTPVLNGAGFGDTNEKKFFSLLRRKDPLNVKDKYINDRKALPFNIPATSKTPSIEYAHGVLSIKGASVPENAVSFYASLSKWADNFIPSGRSLIINIDLDYFSTQSIKNLIAILKKFEALNDVVINWAYDDIDIEECGRDLETMIHVKFNMINKTLTESHKIKKTMKHLKKFNEEVGMGMHPNDPENSKDIWAESNPNLIELKGKIADMISSYIQLREVPYSRSEQTEMEVNPDSIDEAAEQIVDMLYNDGVINDLEDLT